MRISQHYASQDNSQEGPPVPQSPGSKSPSPKGATKAGRGPARQRAFPPARRLSLSHQVPTFESRFSRLARPSRQAYEKVVERDDTGSCDRQPQEQGKILDLIESEQSLQRVNVGPFGGADGYNHGDTQGPGEYTSKQSQQQEQTPKEFDSGSERREEVRERNSPANEILGNLRQVVELAPAAPKKYPTHSHTRTQSRQPRQMCSNLPGPNNQPIDQPPHTRLLCPSSDTRPPLRNYSTRPLRLL